MSVYCFISFAKKLPQKRKVNYRGPVTVLPYKTHKEIPYKMGLQAPIVLNSSVGSLCALSIDSCAVFSVIKTSKRISIDTAGSDAFILVNLPNVKGDTFEASRKIASQFLEMLPRRLHDEGHKLAQTCKWKRNSPNFVLRSREIFAPARNDKKRSKHKKQETECTLYVPYLSNWFTERHTKARCKLTNVIGSYTTDTKYCWKEIKAKFPEFRPLFSRNFAPAKW